MATNDLRDVLDLPGAAGPRQPAPKKQKATGTVKPLKGLAREVQSLGGDVPIAIVPESLQFKKKRLVNRKPAARWELKPFKNSARSDGLILRHWRRIGDRSGVLPPTENTNGDTETDTESKNEPPMEDSVFAKYNVKVKVPKYTDDQYHSNLENPDWTKDETDYLMELVADYDLRWIVIWDRYEYQPPVTKTENDADSTALIPAPKARTMEDLKARYYEIAAKMMAVEKPVQFMGQAEFTLHELMSGFNPAQERARKQFAENALARSNEEKREEESLLVELKRIMARSERLNEERRELYARLEAPPSTSNISMYTTSAGLQQLVQQLANADKDKKRKSIRGPEGLSPAVSTAPNSQATPVDRRESTAQRESVSGPSTNAKKGAPPVNERRKLTDEEERIFGVTHHERLTGGPSFRHEKVNRQLMSKSTVQASRVSNILSELEIPGRLVMPTADVVAQYEQLLAAVNVLLDARKVSDKLDAEIRAAQAIKAEKEKKIKTEHEGGDETVTGDGAAADSSTGVKPSANGQEEGSKEDDDPADSTTAPAADGEGETTDAIAEDDTKLNTGHKRSASVMSAVSDKSSKRQKK